MGPANTLGMKKKGATEMGGAPHGALFVHNLPIAAGINAVKSNAKLLFALSVTLE